MTPGKWYNKNSDHTAECLLCPHHCSILKGETGICGVRKFDGEQLIPLTFGKISTIHLDPIEKKPLFHFSPGSHILSIGTVGCNLHCFFCQNHDISQASPDQASHKPMMPDELVLAAKKQPNNIGLAYTYNEPIISFEYYLETAQKIKAAGLKNIFVSNGFINPDPLQEILPYIDAWNVDLKGFSEEFYRNYTASALKPVMETLKAIKKSKKHLEITSLIIPGLNDNPEQFSNMIDWIASEIGIDTPLHISRYFPRYKSDLPQTPAETLYNFYLAAKEKLPFVYLGNAVIPDTQNTYCPNCGSLSITRSGYAISSRLLPDGKCSSCNTQIAIR